MVTLQHFVLPVWLQSPPNETPRGALEEEFPMLLARYAAWAGDAYGDLVDLWITVNEPGAFATGGFIGGVFPPGKLLALDEFVLVHERFADAHARGLDIWVWTLDSRELAESLLLAGVDAIITDAVPVVRDARARVVPGT